MLVLSRKKDQRIAISMGGKTMYVSVQSVGSRGEVRLGFVGPQEFSIDREEIFLRKRAGEGRGNSLLKSALTAVLPSFDGKHAAEEITTGTIVGLEVAEALVAPQQ